MSGWVRRATVVGALAATLAVAGCSGLPDHVDGELVSGWEPLADPEPAVPEAGVCYRPEYSETVQMIGALHQPTSCTRPHELEAVHVGFFEADPAERSSPPGPGSKEWRNAYRECDREATDYLGADFRHGWFWLGVAVPTEVAWQAGAGWFRCDLMALENYQDILADRDNRIGILADSSELWLGCFTVKEADGGSESASVESMEEVDCSEPHRAEFVGVWHADRSRYPEGDAAELRIHNGCREQVAAYVDVPVDGDLPFRTGTIYGGVSKEEWDNGDRGLRCYLWLKDNPLTESLEGAGDRGLPVR